MINMGRRATAQWSACLSDHAGIARVSTSPKTGCSMATTTGAAVGAGADYPDNGESEARLGVADRRCDVLCQHAAGGDGVLYFSGDEPLCER